MRNQTSTSVNISGGLQDALHDFFLRVLARRLCGIFSLKLSDIVVEQDFLHLLLEPKLQGVVVGKGRSHFFHQGVAKSYVVTAHGLLFVVFLLVVI
jgi:hypothetical protein